MGVKDSELKALLKEIVDEMEANYIKECRAQGIKPLTWEERISEVTNEIIESMSETSLIEQGVVHTLLGIG